MEEKTKELFKLFKIGVENERKAQEYYKDLIRRSTSEMEKEIFGSFLREEEKHERRLMEAYGEMKEKFGLR